MSPYSDIDAKDHVGEDAALIESQRRLREIQQRGWSFARYRWPPSTTMNRRPTTPTEKFVRDFADAWVKVMEPDRFDLR